MKSYILAITVTMFFSALYAYQNIGDVTVRFLLSEWVFPQGVFEILLFCIGAALMWIFSVFSVFEVRGKYKKEIKQKDDRIAELENEKKMLTDSLYSMKASSDSNLFSRSSRGQTILNRCTAYRTRF